jgi:hypothetical protein
VSPAPHAYTNALAVLPSAFCSVFLSSSCEIASAFSPSLSLLVHISTVRFPTAESFLSQCFSPWLPVLVCRYHNCVSLLLPALCLGIIAATFSKRVFPTGIPALFLIQTKRAVGLGKSP